jgi:hypothetical protein
MIDARDATLVDPDLSVSGGWSFGTTVPPLTCDAYFFDAPIRWSAFLLYLGRTVEAGVLPRTAVIVLPSIRRSA